MSNKYKKSVGIFAFTNDALPFETGVTSYNLDLVSQLCQEFPEINFVVYLAEANSLRFRRLDFENLTIISIQRFTGYDGWLIKRIPSLRERIEFQFYSKISSLASHDLLIYTVFGLFQAFPFYVFKRLGSPCVSVVHDIRLFAEKESGLLGTMKQKFKISRLYRIVESSKIILLPSIHSIKMMESRLPSNKYRVSYSVPNVDEEIPTPSSPDGMSSILNGEPFFYFPATIVATKNHSALLYALFNLRNRGIFAKLILTGSNWSSSLGRAIKNSIHDLGLVSHVIHLGFVSEADKRWLFTHATAAIFPTENESFNLGIWEAFALKCPVITSTDSEMQEQVEDAAILVNLNKQDELWMAMKKLLDSSQDRDALKKRGRDRYKKVLRRSLFTGWETELKVFSSSTL